MTPASLLNKMKPNETGCKKTKRMHISLIDSKSLITQHKSFIFNTILIYYFLKKKCKNKIVKQKGSKHSAMLKSEKKLGQLLKVCSEHKPSNESSAPRNKEGWRSQRRKWKGFGLLGLNTASFFQFPPVEKTEGNRASRLYSSRLEIISLCKNTQKLT